MIKEQIIQVLAELLSDMKNFSSLPAHKKAEVAQKLKLFPPAVLIIVRCLRELGEDDGDVVRAFMAEMEKIRNTVVGDDGMFGK